MSRAFFLSGCFLSGAIASSLLAWLGSLTDSTHRPVMVVYGFAALAIILALVLDDPISEALRVQPSQYYAGVIACTVALLLGLGATVLCLR